MIIQTLAFNILLQIHIFPIDPGTTLLKLASYLCWYVRGADSVFNMSELHYKLLILKAGHNT